MPLGRLVICPPAGEGKGRGRAPTRTRGASAGALANPSFARTSPAGNACGWGTRLKLIRVRRLPHQRWTSVSGIVEGDMLGVLEGSPAAAHQRSPEAPHIGGGQEPVFLRLPGEKRCAFARSPRGRRCARSPEVRRYIEMRSVAGTCVDTAAVNRFHPRMVTGPLASLRGHLCAGPGG